MDYNFCVPCLLGLEGPISDELRRLDIPGVRAENGRVYFTGGGEELARANINLRIGERILLEVGGFTALSFDELFERTKALPWERIIPRDGAFPVKGYSLNSKLFSVSDCQKIIKKAIVERLKRFYGIEWFAETGSLYQIQFSIMKDHFSLCIDTSGDGLHKRGYRPAHNAAPLKETMAAAMVKLSRYRGRDDFCDPFCGSGTIPIEAAMMAAQIAPGMKRDFTFRRWKNIISEGVFEDTIEEANDMVNPDIVTDIQGFDIDDKMVSIARENAKMAGVDHLIHFQRRDVKDLSHPKKYGFIITNPPYGERLEDKKDLPELYKTIGQRFAALDSFSMYLITAYDQAERDIGRKADKNRKIYNGMLKTYYYQFMGPKPPKEKRQ